MPESPSTNDRILVFIPGYNCAKQIGRVIAQLTSTTAPPISEILVVDNRSTDGTADVAAAALQKASPSKWKVVRNQSNYNLGGSHKVAFNYALEHGFTHIIVLHGDDQASIQDFTAPIAAGLHRKHDSLLGARFMKGSQLQGYSLYRRIGNSCCSAGLPTKVRDSIFTARSTCHHGFTATSTIRWCSRT